MTCIDMNLSTLDSHMYLQESNFRTSKKFSVQPQPRPRRPALIPHNASLTLAEAEELVRTRINQPLFPPPDPDLISRVNSKPPAPIPAITLSTTLLPQAETVSRTEHHSAAKIPSTPTPRPVCNQHEPPPPIRPMHRHSFPTSLPKHHSSLNPSRALYLKARAHYIRDLKRRLTHPSSHQPQRRAESLPHAADAVTDAPVSFLPKRKHSAFLLDEERKYRLEDVVGTPHLSEMVPGDLNIEDSRMGEPAVVDLDVRGDGDEIGKGDGSKEAKEGEGICC